MRLTHAIAVCALVALTGSALAAQAPAGGQAPAAGGGQRAGGAPPAASQEPAGAP